jgi:hypothetical protein
MSTDGGKTFTKVPTPHGDNHGLWIDPRDSRRMIEGNDGGACVSFDGGHTWSSLLNQPTAQFYHVAADDRVPYNVYGSQQDNWAMRLPSIDFEGAISWKDFTEPGGGESGYIAISPRPPHTVFGGGIGTGPGHGRLIAWNPETGHKRNITVWPEVFGSGVGASALKYRFQWTFPVEMSPHDPGVLYICSNHVHRSRDEGANWELISPDLTRNDPDRLGPSGGPITADNSGAEIYCTIFALRESPHERGVFWAGSDDGLLHLSRDSGRTWERVTPPDLPDWALISIIEPSPHDAATAYVAATRYKLDDTAPYLFRTNDYGATWTRITSGLPADAITRVIREDPNQRGLLYAGTETGVCVSLDDGVNWQPLEGNLPVTPIHDLLVKGTDLIAATHGRSFWILDDVTPLYHMRTTRPDEPVTLYKPRDTVRFKFYERMGFAPQTPGYVTYKVTGPVTVAYRPIETPSGVKTQQHLDSGKNPPTGVIIHYAFSQEPEGEVTLSILDMDGIEVRSFSSKPSGTPGTPRVPVEAGANRFIWDMRYARPTPLDDDKKQDDPNAQRAEAAVAARAVPGDYQVRLTAGDTTVTQTFTLLADPRLSATAEDLRAQFELKSAICQRVDDVHRAINQVRRVRKQVEGWEERAKSGAGDERLVEASTALKGKLAALEDELINVDADKPQPGPNRLKEKLATLAAMIEESDDAPTQGAREVYDSLGEQVEAQLAALQHIIAQDVRAFNDLVRLLELPPVEA